MSHVAQCIKAVQWLIFAFKDSHRPVPVNDHFESFGGLVARQTAAIKILDLVGMRPTF
jgi:hypothetical protein